LNTCAENCCGKAAVMLTAVNMTGTKNVILAAACDIYLQEGYKGMSMRKVASKAGISPTAIYRHYENKEALHHQVLREGFRTFDSYLQRALDGQNALERLNLAADRFFAFAAEQKKYYEILFLTMDHTVEHKVKGTLSQDATVSHGFMVDRVRDCMEEGTLKDDDPDEVAMLLLSTCNGFFGLYVSKKRTGTPAQMKAKYERMYRRLLNGLLS
jgi:AcrR family transcriptional regulator